MLPKCLILVGRLGVLAASIASSAAGSHASDPENILVAEFPSYEAFAIATSSPPPQARPAIRIAQNTPDRNTVPAAIPNTANVSLQMTPGQSVSVGTKVSFRVTTRKPGYLLLVDIDPGGRMTQIFPSPEMVAQAPEAATNFIRPGDELLIPNAAARKNGFEYVITAPAGDAAVVAILSDRRVQLLDLPDNAQTARTGAEAAGLLAGWTRELRVPDGDSGKLLASQWSFDVKPYSIAP
jgi:hypothetical protein